MAPPESEMEPGGAAPPDRNSEPPTSAGLRAQLKQALQRLAERNKTNGAAPLAAEIAFEVRRTRASKNGDERSGFVSNAALVWAAHTGETAGEVARQLLAEVEWSGDAGEANGFLNFGMNDSMMAVGIARALHERERYGAGETLAGTRVLVEFVSADPAGLLPLAAARPAAMGEALCRLLALQGAQVTREYYLNDALTSSKVRLLGESVAAFYAAEFGHGSAAPEGAMADAFVRGIAHAIAEREGNRYLLMPEDERAALFARKALEAVVTAQKATLREFGVRFDVWSSEQSLYDDGRVSALLARLRERGHLYDRDGAQWLRTSAFGDEADRTLVRANGNPTYLATDIAYHIFKMERGFDRIINIWSAEHRQYIARTVAALQAAGGDSSRVEVLTCGGARWLRDGTPAQRGAGGGAFTLDEALRALGADTLRFWLLPRDWDDGADIDADRARRDDETNPAYAARLLPARLDTLLREAEAKSGGTASSTQNGGTTPAWSDADRELARWVTLWPDTAQTAAQQRAPQTVARFVSEMAEAVRALVKSGAPADSASAPRRDLLRAAAVTASNALQSLGMSAAARL